MKKNLFSIVAVLFISGTVFSQKISYGPQLGVNISSHHLTSNGGGYSTSSLAGLQAGAFVAVSLPLKFAVQLDLLYNQTGARYKQTSTGNVHDTKANYFSIAIVPKYNIWNKLSICVGPQMNFVLNSKAKEGNASFDNKAYQNTTDFSLVAGLEYKFPLGIKLGVRYQTSFNNQFKTADAYNENAKLNLISITAGYTLPF